jgi:hypothetical protein
MIAWKLVKYFANQSADCDRCGRADDLKARVSKTRVAGGRSVAEEEDDD